jgi:carboxyl-terminal processing protease
MFLHRAVACAAALSLVGCAGFDPNNILGRQPLPPVTTGVPVEPPAAGLTEEIKRAAVDFVWTTVRDRYLDPALNGVDWAAARVKHEPLIMAATTDFDFWERLDRMTGELRDSHTRVHSPLQLEDQQQFRSVSLGVSMRLIDDAYWIANVAPDSDAWWAGMRPGMQIKTWDGVDIAMAVEQSLAQTRETSSATARQRRALSRLSTGELGTRVAVQVLRFDGTPLTATLERRASRTAPTLTARKLPSGHGYIRFNAWNGGLTERLVNAIREFKDTPGLIFDLRDNGGGSAQMVGTLAAQLVQGKVNAGERTTRTGRPISVAWNLYPIFKLDSDIVGVQDPYTGPVTVIVNEGSASASELFAGSLQSLGRARIVGARTCGCLLAYFGYALVPGGGGLAYSEMGFRTAKGQVIEREGVMPDRPVAVSTQDLREGRDRFLEAALLPD